MDPFRRRAEEMGIELIENAHLMNDDELLARLKKGNRIDLNARSDLTRLQMPDRQRKFKCLNN